MEFKVDIKSRNDAMADKDSVISILVGIANELHHGEDSGMIRDTNGNTVGNWTYLRHDDN